MRKTALPLPLCSGANNSHADAPKAERRDQTSPQRTDRRTFSTRELALYLNMSESALRQARIDGQRQNHFQGPPYLKLGRKVIYLQEDVEAWLAQHKIAAQEK